MSRKSTPPLLVSHLKSKIQSRLPPSIHGNEGVYEHHAYNLHDATTSSIHRTVESATKSQIQQSIKDAQIAQQNWFWNHTQIQRNEVVLRIHDVLASNQSKVDKLIELEVGDTSRPISEIRSYDVPATIRTLSYYANSISSSSGAPTAANRLHLSDLDSNANANSMTSYYTQRIPLGTTLGIGAWNYPLVNCISKSIPAILYGNSMIYKPSEYTPSSALFMAELYEEAGLPQGVFQVILGGYTNDGNYNVGQTLVEEYCSSVLHANTNGKISFTGSVHTGHQIAKQTTNNNDNNFAFHKLNLELGGKSPLIIMEDCNMNNAIQNAIIANWYSNGQVCSNGTRIYVHESRYDEFVDKIVKETSKLNIGHPLNDNVDIGPMIHKEHMEKVLEYIHVGIHDDGATLCYGGERLTGPMTHGCNHTSNDDGNDDGQSLLYDNGYFLSPAIFVDCNDEMRIVQEEVFGMVMTIMKFKDEEEVIKRANGTKYGLAAGIVSNDICRAQRIASKLVAGTVWINTYNIADVEVPWGGVKQSGIGCENGTAAMEAWTTEKVMYINAEEE